MFIKLIFDILNIDKRLIFWERKIDIFYCLENLDCLVLLVIIILGVYGCFYLIWFYF